MVETIFTGQVDATSALVAGHWGHCECSDVPFFCPAARGTVSREDIPNSGRFLPEFSRHCGFNVYSGFIIGLQLIKITVYFMQ